MRFLVCPRMLPRRISRKRKTPFWHAGQDGYSMQDLSVLLQHKLTCFMSCTALESSSHSATSNTKVCLNSGGWISLQGEAYDQKTLKGFLLIRLISVQPCDGPCAPATVRLPACKCACVLLHVAQTALKEKRVLYSVLDSSSVRVLMFLRALRVVSRRSL